MISSFLNYSVFPQCCKQSYSISLQTVDKSGAWYGLVKRWQTRSKQFSYVFMPFLFLSMTWTLTDFSISGSRRRNARLCRGIDWGKHQISFDTLRSSLLISIDVPVATVVNKLVIETYCLPCGIEIRAP